MIREAQTTLVFDLMQFTLSLSMLRFNEGPEKAAKPFEIGDDDTDQVLVMYPVKLREIVASHIVDMAIDGERDPKRLRAATLVKVATTIVNRK